ncbi:MAG TPA: hypothetical protein VFH97_10705, partial [Gemmatimonadales bacterium]|nr:hypothetical protein [Gemmatimonadales bacterium]
LTAKTGCAVCDPVRRNLVVIGDRPEEAVDLGDLTTEALAAARARLKFLRSLKPDDKRYSGRELMELVRTIAVMADAARKIRKEGIAAVNSMTFQERAELFVEWFRDLPPAHRTYVTEQLGAAAQDLQ